MVAAGLLAPFRLSFSFSVAGEGFGAAGEVSLDAVERPTRFNETTVKEYNHLIGCVEGRGGAFSLARKLHEQGIGQEEIAELKPLELVPRDLLGDDWSPAEECGTELATSTDIPTTDEQIGKSLG